MEILRIYLKKNVSGKKLPGKAFNIANNLQYN